MTFHGRQGNSSVSDIIFANKIEEYAMDKVAFVVVRYGLDVNGGAEYHVRMLAERLVGRYDVEVLTTCVKDYITGEKHYPVGEELINGVRVRRFNADPINADMESSYWRKTKKARKLRRFLYRIHLLTPLSYLFPVWRYQAADELNLLNSHVFYSSQLFSFIEEHKDAYKAIIPISIDFPQMHYAALAAPEKTIVIPTMHNHSGAFRSILTSVFTKVAYVAFNTRAEEKLGERVFGHALAPHGIISVGINIAEPADWEMTQAKYKLPAEYLLYVGRIEVTKLHHIFTYFLSYKEKYKDSRLKLVMVGGLFSEPFLHPDIMYTDFIDESEKIAIIQHAKIIINPSKHESLSLILLEAMSLKKAMLVNGLCAVLKEHCKESHNAALWYTTKRGFIKRLRQLDVSEALREEMGEKGFNYVQKNYKWDLIMERLVQQIESLK